MDARQARQIIEIWKRRSLGGAARALKISQPTLSRSLARVEDQLGVTLFERGPNGATPTTYADYIVSRIAPAMERMDSLAMEVQQMARGEAGRLRIGAAPLARATILEEVCLEVARRFPNLRIQVSHEPADALAQKLVARALDIAFSSSGVLNTEALRHDHEARAFALFAYDTGFHAHRDHPILAVDGELSTEDILSYPIASLAISRSLRECFPVSLTDAQNTNLRALQAGDYGIVRGAVVAGRCIGFGPTPVFQKDLASGEVVRLKFGVARERSCIGLIMPEYLQSPLAKQVIDIASEAARRMEGVSDPR